MYKILSSCGADYSNRHFGFILYKRKKKWKTVLGEVRNKSANAHKKTNTKWALSIILWLFIGAVFEYVTHLLLWLIFSVCAFLNYLSATEQCNICIHLPIEIVYCVFISVRIFKLFCNHFVNPKSLFLFFSS